MNAGSIHCIEKLVAWRLLAAMAYSTKYSGSYWFVIPTDLVNWITHFTMKALPQLKTVIPLFKFWKNQDEDMRAVGSIMFFLMSIQMD